jgi:hypothetical protein
MYYPSGLTLDNSTYGVWDYELRYGYCPNNNTFAFAKQILSPRRLSAKPALEKPANLAAKPRAQNLAAVGGLKALFSGKNAQKTFANLPSKATFAVKKDEPAVAGKTFSLFSNFAASTKNAKPQAMPAGEDKMAKFKSFVNNLKPENLVNEDLKKEIDMAFLIADTNKDGLISKAEMKAAIQSTGDSITDEELNFVFMFIDANQDGQISW